MTERGATETEFLEALVRRARAIEGVGNNLSLNGVDSAQKLPNVVFVPDVDMDSAHTEGEAALRDAQIDVLIFGSTARVVSTLKQAVKDAFANKKQDILKQNLGDNWFVRIHSCVYSGSATSYDELQKRHVCTFILSFGYSVVVE